MVTARDPCLQLAHIPAALQTGPSVRMLHQFLSGEMYQLSHGIRGISCTNDVPRPIRLVVLTPGRISDYAVQEPVAVDDQPRASAAAGANKTPLMLQPSHPAPSPQLPSQALKPSVPSYAVQAATTDQARQCLAVIELVSVHSARRCTAQLAMCEVCPVPLHSSTQHSAAQHRSGAGIVLYPEDVGLGLCPQGS